MPFYALFLVLIPATAGLGAAVAAFAIGALFTAQIVVNPFYASAHPGEHAKSAPLRFLPIEMTLIDDLPVAQNDDRRMVPLGGSPRVWAYFPDDNAYNPEGEWFWVKGKSTAEVVLRGPVDSAGANEWISKAITRLNVEVRNGGARNRVTISTGRDSKSLEMEPGELKTLSLAVRMGVPFRRDVQPTSYLYAMSVKTTAGFVPFLENPCQHQPERCPPGDARFLGAMVHVIPEYTDADITRWVAPGAVAAGKDEAGGV